VIVVSFVLTMSMITAEIETRSSLMVVIHEGVMTTLIGTYVGSTVAGTRPEDATRTIKASVCTMGIGAHTVMWMMVESDHLFVVEDVIANSAIAAERSTASKKETMEAGATAQISVTWMATIHRPSSITTADTFASAETTNEMALEEAIVDQGLLLLIARTRMVLKKRRAP
jgi:hypothetical protein